ncbi:MAG: MFS transporter [Candidatus Heimdallarchaeaceae archaeon]
MGDIQTISENNTKTSDEPVLGKFSYRWIVLAVFSLMTFDTQVLWLTFAPITKEVANTYNISTNWILMLSMVFMVVYIPFNSPAIISIEKLGLRFGAGIGVLLTGLFAFLRGFFITNFVWIFIAQTFIAIGQPFVLNSFTKLAVNWFPEEEKTLATGLNTMTLLLGAVIAFMLTPVLYTSLGLKGVLLTYGILSLAFAVLYLIAIREKPAIPPNLYSIKDQSIEVSKRDAIKNKDFIILFSLVLIGLGIFNAVSTEIDILFNDPNNISASGNIGGAMIIGGIIGAVILSTLSDKYHKRKIFLIIAMAVGAILIIMLYYLNSYIARLIEAFFLGFFLVAALPVALTFAAEITYPLPEEVSNGWMMWAGQISGIALILCVMFIPSLIVNYFIIAALFAIGFFLSFAINDVDKYTIAASDVR